MSNRLFPSAASQDTVGLGSADQRNTNTKGRPSTVPRTREGACQCRGAFVTMSRLRKRQSLSSGRNVQPRSRSWYEAWRVSCGFCHQPFHIGSDFADQTKGPLVPDALWKDAVNGSRLFDRYLVGKPCGWLPPPLVWTLASAPIHSPSPGHFRVAFELIVPEANHAVYGALHQSPCRTFRTQSV